MKDGKEGREEMDFMRDDQWQSGSSSQQQQLSLGLVPSTQAPQHSSLTPTLLSFEKREAALPRGAHWLERCET